MGPIDIQCPRCGAMPNQKCRVADLGERSRSHQERADSWREYMKLLEVEASQILGRDYREDR